MQNALHAREAVSADHAAHVEVVDAWPAAWGWEGICRAEDGEGDGAVGSRDGALFMGKGLVGEGDFGGGSGVLSVAEEANVLGEEVWRRGDGGQDGGQLGVIGDLGDICRHDGLFR